MLAGKFSRPESVDQKETLAFCAQVRKMKVCTSNLLQVEADVPSGLFADFLPLWGFHSGSQWTILQ